MGNALVVAAVAEEELGRASLWGWVDDDEHGRRLVQLHEFYSQDEWWTLRRDTAELLRRHPDAFYQLRIGLGDVWDPPEEPRGRRDPDSRRARALRAKHARAVSRSLDTFLASHLKLLEGMVRTGWWILRTVDVRVTRVLGTPELKKTRGRRQPPGRAGGAPTRVDRSPARRGR